MTENQIRQLALRPLAAALAATFALTLPAAWAGPDDDARFRSNGTTRNSIDPIVGGGLLADFPTNAEPNTGLRIMPPTGTQLIEGQRFDLRVETQIPAATPPQLVKLTVNGLDITRRFNARIAAQGSGLESGTPSSELLYGSTARNLSFDQAGLYVVEATVLIDGTHRTIRNTLAVAGSPFDGGGERGTPRIDKVVFFLGDAMGLPVRTAARIYGRGIFEGRSKGRLNLDQMDEQGFSITASFDSVITDSAPGMATYVTGMKQPNNALNVSADNTPETSRDNPRIETLWEYMKRMRGWKIGVVTDAFVTDATPAATAVHTRARSDRQAIAQQMLDFYRDGTAQPATGYAALKALTQPLDVIMGGGAVDWLKSDNADVKSFYQYAAGGRSDVDLFATIAPGLGYATARNLAELDAAPDNKPLLAIFSGEFRTTSSGLGTDNIPGALDRLVARGAATIRGKGADDPEIGMSAEPPQGTGCGATIKDCFAGVPSKRDMVRKAVKVLDTLAGRKGGWMLLVEQSQSDKLAHPLEYERTVYEVLELDDSIGWVRDNVARDGRTLMVATADHAQPETIIGVALPDAITAGGATAPGGCFTIGSGNGYPVTLGSNSDPDRPCPLQDVVGTFNDGTFPTYQDANHDGFPDDPDPLVKLVIEDGGRPTYSTDFLTNYQPLNPSGANAAKPNPARDADGLLMTGNMPTRSLPAGANKTNGNTTVAPHSGDDVPISASGPGAALFGGVQENADVHVKIAAALAGKQQRRQLDMGSHFTAVPNRRPSGSNLNF